MNGLPSAMSEERLRDKFRGAILGTMVGDALGAPVEGWECDRLNATLDDFLNLEGKEREQAVSLLGLITGADFGPGQAHYTDDTEMTFSVAESLVELGSISEPDIARRFAQNFDPGRGYGPGAQSVLTAIKEGAPWYEPAEQVFNGQGSFGNGAAMRVAPVGVFYHSVPAHELRVAAERQAVITHTHLLGIEGAVMQAAAVSRALRFDPDAEDFDPNFFLTMVSAHLRDDMDDYLAACDTLRILLRQEPDIQDVADAVECGIEAHLSVPAALYAFLAHWDSFSEAVSYAVRLGGDTDTVGAMCGAIAGAFHGASAIPPNWLDALENGPKGRDYAFDLADRLFNTYRRVFPAQTSSQGAIQ